MIKIEIKSSEVSSRNWEFEGKSGVVRAQYAWAHVGDEYPVKIKIRLKGNNAPYAPGFYQLAPSNLHVYQGALSLNKYLELSPLQQSRAA